MVPATHAFHSRHMEPILEQFRIFAVSVEHKMGHFHKNVQFVSGMEGKIIDRTNVNANYWVRHTREPVQFMAACETLRSLGVTNYLEVGAHPILSNFVTLNNATSENLTCFPSLRRGADDWKTMLLSLGKLYLLGYDINWTGFEAPYHRRKIPYLPNHPYEKQSFWKESRGAKKEKVPNHVHPLAGSPFENAMGHRLFQNDLDLESVPFIRDHCIGSRIVFPGAAFLEMVAAVSHLSKNDIIATKMVQLSQAVTLENFQILAPLEIRENESVRFQVAFGNGETNGANLVNVYSRSVHEGEDNRWILHGTSTYLPGGVSSLQIPAWTPQRISKCLAAGRETPSEAFYGRVKNAKMDFGPQFQSIRQFWPGNTNELVAEVGFNVMTPKDTSYLLHPILIDAVLQVGVAYLYQGDPSESLRLPVSIGKFVLFPPSPEYLTNDAQDSLLVHVWKAHGKLCGCLLTKSLRPLAYFEDIQYVTTSLPNFMAALGEQGKTVPESWEETWKRIKTPRAGFVTAEGSNMAKEPEEKTQSWVVFLSRHSTKLAKLVTALSAVFKVTTIYPSLEQMEAYTHLGVMTTNHVIANDEGQLGNLLKGMEKIAGVIFGQGVDVTPGSLPLALSFLQVAQFLLQEEKPPLLYVLTEGAVSVGNEPTANPEAAILHGMAKSLKSENVGLHIRCIDLESHPACLKGDLAPRDEDINTLIQEITRGWGELEKGTPFQRAFRGKSQFEPKFVKCALPTTKDQLQLPEGGSQYQLILPSSRSISDLRFGLMEGNVVLGGDKVELRVTAYGLNFKDVLTVLKPSAEFEKLNTVGLDFAGVVTRVGEGRNSYKTGDRVFGVNMKESQLPNRIVIKTDYITRVPDSMTLWQAATLPTVFCTAYYCLVTVARIKKGDTALIHTGSGGVGLAAIQLCKHFGVNVISTAGSPSKRAYLKSLGIEHVFDSRSLEYAEGVRQVTNGRGVDVVLNSLTGPGFKEATLSTCVQNARFVEMSKLSIWTPEEAGKLRPDVEYTIVDLTALDAMAFGALLSKLHEFLVDGVVTSIPFVKFDAPRIRQAFEYFQKARHIGKIICTMPDASTATGSQDSCTTSLFNRESTYLITGGLGGAGWQVCQWMLGKGATNIVLMGRRPPPPDIVASLEELKKQGFTIEAILANVGDFEECRQTFQRIKGLKRPLGGIIHCAGVLQDAPYPEQDESTIKATFMPKVMGTWNLHNLSKDLPLEHFVLFSSVSSLFGPNAQANYAAANSFVDAFARYRRSNGLPATLINWGQWAQVGMAKNMRIPGVLPVSVKRMLNGLETLLRMPNPQVTLCDFESFTNYSIICPLVQQYVDPALFERHGKQDRTTARHTSNKNSSDVTTEAFWDILEKMPGRRDRLDYIQQLLKSLIRNALGMGAEEDLSVTVHMADLGVDSLFSLQLKNKLQAIIGPQHNLSTDMFQTSQSLETLSRGILTKITDCYDGLDTEPVLKQRLQKDLRMLLESDCELPESIRSPGGEVCRPSQISSVFVTGATGFLGGYIVDVLDGGKYESVKEIVCLARPCTKQSIGVGSNGKGKIKYVEGDISLPNLGMSLEVYQKLCGRIDAIIHCAAKTSHIEPYRQIEETVKHKKDIRTVNVLGTTNILKFACTTKVKHVFYASSSASAGTLCGTADTLSDSWPERSLIDAVVDSEIPGYQISKFVCEVLLEQANRRGIPCKVFRFPSISGNSRTSEINFENNHLIHRFITNLQIKAVPEVALPMNNLPVDFCAEASLHLFFSDDAPCEIYFLIHPRPQLEREFASLTEPHFGVQVAVVGLEQFSQGLQKAETPLELFSELYTNTDRLLKIFSAPGIQEYVKSPGKFKNDKIFRYFPGYGEDLESPLEYVVRDLKYVQAKGFFSNIL